MLLRGRQRLLPASARMLKGIGRGVSSDIPNGGKSEILGKVKGL